jgi:hypothetical protein
VYWARPLDQYVKITRIARSVKKICKRENSPIQGETLGTGTEIETRLKRTEIETGK